tara:strand:+ start:42 stop:683 length:642 start_codon:yes stop_codon:yes gene_type:complete
MESKESRQHHEIFKKELVENSIGEDFLEAKKEWLAQGSYTICCDASRECICTKKINNIFIIQNKHNNVTLEIGSECYKHIDKEQAKKAIKEYKDNKDRFDNPEKYCSKCNVKYKKKKNEDTMYCKCDKLTTLKETGRLTKFKFGKYRQFSWLYKYEECKHEQEKLEESIREGFKTPFSYVEYLKRFKIKTQPVVRFIKWFEEIRQVELEIQEN